MRGAERFAGVDLDGARAMSNFVAIVAAVDGEAAR